jgi:hypothetical protein
MPAPEHVVADSLANGHCKIICGALPFQYLLLKKFPIVPFLNRISSIQKKIESWHKALRSQKLTSIRWGRNEDHGKKLQWDY